MLFQLTVPTLLLLVFTQNLSAFSIRKSHKSTHGVVEVPESCRDLTFCTEKAKDYPEERFNKILKKHKFPPLPTYEIYETQEGDIELQDDCESSSQYEIVYYARERVDQPWRTVIQAPEYNFVQRVRWVACESKGSSCFNGFRGLYQTTCQQSYGYWDLLVESQEGVNLILKASVPTCCSCKYENIYKTP